MSAAIQYDQICIFQRCSAHPTSNPLPTPHLKPVGGRWEAMDTVVAREGCFCRKGENQTEQETQRRRVSRGPLACTNREGGQSWHPRK